MITWRTPLLDLLNLLGKQSQKTQFLLGTLQLRRGQIRSKATSPLCRLQATQVFLLGHNEIGAVERNQVIAFANGDSRVIDEEAIQPTADPGCNIRHPGFVGNDLANHADLCAGVRPLDRRGLNIRQRRGAVRQRQSPWILVLSRLFLERDQIHETDRAFSRLGQDDLRVHGTSPTRGFLRGFFRGFIHRGLRGRIDEECTDT